ncbi:MAG TPA: M20 family metallo-hydrolase [Tepidisphaeraceae bacterium]|jgi:hydantoinase/carbamoylase family amidase
MKINADRIAADLDRIAAMTDTPGQGSGRPTFSPQWAEARDYVIAEAKAAGCDVRVDAAGNVHARQASFGWDQPAWLSGSHVDSVPHGGTFDGVTGVVVPLEILRAAAEAQQAVPLELVVFAEEEGTTFNLGMLGSRAWAGTLSAAELAKLRNKGGVDPLTAGRPYGVVADWIGLDVIDPKQYRGLIEVHVEQGPAMWEKHIPVAIVNAINGRRQFRCTIHGVANHAGSTPMSYRQDALAAAAECIVGLEKFPTMLSTDAVLTVGRIEAKPNALNVIADTVTFSIDFRSPKNEHLEAGSRAIRQAIAAIVGRRKLTADLAETEILPAVTLDTGVVDALQKAAATAGLGDVPTTHSGALHDAAILAPRLPTAMIFVASKDGISHNPAEFSRIEDIAKAAELLAAVVTL